MEGFLLPYAPPFKVSEKKDDKEEKNRLPLRLMSLKNGVRDVAKAIAVVGPDLRNVSSLLLMIFIWITGIYNPSIFLKRCNILSTLKVKYLELDKLCLSLLLKHWCLEKHSFEKSLFLEIFFRWIDEEGCQRKQGWQEKQEKQTDGRSGI